MTSWVVSRLLAILSVAIFLVLHVSAQTAASSASATTAPRTITSARNSTTSTSSRSSAATSGAAPDVYLNVPELHVGRIELTVDKLSADLNLNAKVANLVQLNAGVQVSVEKVNITIAEVDAEVELVIRLGHLVDIVGRVFDSLDLNPLLINTISNVTSLVGEVVGDVVGAVDGLLGSITQGGKTLNFVVDNLGNIVQEVGGVSSIVGDFTKNMTETGVAKSVGQGLTQKEYSYSPLNALVDIVFNSAGQVVQAVVQKKNGAGSSSSGSGGGSNSTVSAAAASLRR
ncbi:hypothetical protein D6C86_09829 [Aureobasidium pullulans]|uniref:Uncharacterized protein n=1 Tax=Aureobasidium pullulans TaxID=5580 RepID=A0A4S9UL14_AURPU|nr:hypothetical protein D6D17_06474 [Aureobasidium pullulans]THY68204.1 hypothetical protein D6C94_10358 [Aureobasidium pullulans]THZ38447.1 hypothetical protein D6C87_07797 [Aureobasidium pullulans]THZ53497.1 hypothetical protein D6C86_09829 [Aureobasidium pullulans]TIA54009.1 hypothetical protein D6C79_01205 [Aureobasidium pullulans]